MNSEERKIWQEEVKNERAEMLKGAIERFADSENFKEYLKFMQTFHQYSACNSLLIWFQGGTLVAGYKAWAEKGRTVKKGEKAIRIYAPIIGKGMFTAYDGAGNPIVDENGNEVKVSKSYVKGFRRVSVFDVSQTEGDDIPVLAEPKMLSGDMSDEQFDEVFASISKATTASIGFEDIDNGANGYFALKENRIAIKNGMSHEQTIKTLIHEVTHSLLHNEKAMKDKVLSREQKEVEAESVAYLVCSYIGIDSADYSFDYVGSWAMGDVKMLEKSMSVIKQTADKIIEVFSDNEKVA